MTDTAVQHLAHRFSKRRTLLHLVAITIAAVLLFGGWVSAVARATDQGNGNEYSWPTAIVMIIVGTLLGAWGGSRGGASSYPLWLLITFAIGWLFVLTLVVPRLMQVGYELWTDRSGKGGEKAPTLSMSLLSPADADSVLGPGARGPKRVASLGKASIAQWTSADDKTWLSINVRHSTRLARKLTTFGERKDYTKLPRCGDGGVLMHRETGGKTTLGVQAAKGQWVVSISTMGKGEAATGAGEQLAAMVQKALDTMESSDTRTR